MRKLTLGPLDRDEDVSLGTRVVVGRGNRGDDVPSPALRNLLGGSLDADARDEHALRDGILGGYPLAARKHEGIAGALVANLDESAVPLDSGALDGALFNLLAHVGTLNRELGNLAAAKGIAALLGQGGPTHRPVRSRELDEDVAVGARVANVGGVNGDGVLCQFFLHPLAPRSRRQFALRLVRRNLLVEPAVRGEEALLVPVRRVGRRVDVLDHDVIELPARAPARVIVTDDHPANLTQKWSLDDKHVSLAALEVIRAGGELPFAAIAVLAIHGDVHVGVGARAALVRGVDRDDVSESLVIAVSRVHDLRNLVRGFTLAEPSVDAERLPHAGRGVGDLHGRAMPRRGAEQAAGVVVSDANALNLPDILTLDVEDVLGASFKVIHRVVEGELAAVTLVAKDDERDVRVAAAAANVRGDHLHYVVVHRRVAGSRGLERDSQVLVLEPVVVVKENFGLSHYRNK